MKLNGFLIKSKILKSDNSDDYLVAGKKQPSRITGQGVLKNGIRYALCDLMKSDAFGHSLFSEDLLCTDSGI